MHLPCGSPDKSNPDAINIKYKKKSSDARTHFCWLGITKHSVQPGGLLTLRPTVAHSGAISSTRSPDDFTLERAHTLPYTIFTASRKIDLKLRVTSLISGEDSRNLSARFAGYIPAKCRSSNANRVWSAKNHQNQ